MTNRVLIAWEFGSGLGHLACMVPIIRALRGSGVEPLVAVPDPDRARIFFGADSPRVIQCIPLPLALKLAPQHPVNSHADILLQGGFANVETLAAAVEAWRVLYRDERIDTVLLDYAPAAQLAAWLSGLRMVTASSAFASPPVPLPPLRATNPQVADLMEKSERTLLANVNQVITRAGRKRLESLEPWLNASTRFFTGTSHVNMFDIEPQGGYLGPLGAQLAHQQVDWPRSSRPRLLCYLRWSRHIPSVIKSLDRADREILCAIPQASPQWIQSVPNARVRVFRTPVDLQPLIRTADVVVSHASGGLACEALIAGKPQLFVPFDREKVLIAQRLTRLKVGLTLPPSRPATQASASVQRLLDDGGFAAAAKGISASIEPQEWKAAMRKLVEYTVAS